MSLAGLENYRPDVPNVEARLLADIHRTRASVAWIWVIVAIPFGLMLGGDLEMNGYGLKEDYPPLTEVAPGVWAALPEVIKPCWTVTNPPIIKKHPKQKPSVYAGR